jgi:hypothetical protein
MIVHGGFQLLAAYLDLPRVKTLIDQGGHLNIFPKMDSHRLMACVLWGQHLIKPETLHIVKSKADPELHSALIFIKKLLCEGVEDKYKFWLAFENHDPMALK